MEAEWRLFPKNKYISKIILKRKKKWGTQKGLVPRSPTGPCMVLRLLSPNWTPPPSPKSVLFLKVILWLSLYINHNITVFGFILVRETTGTSGTFNSFCSTFPDHPPEWVLSVYMPTVSLQESLFPHSLATKLGNFHSFNCCQSDRGEWLSHACFHFISLITGEAGHVFQPHPILLQSSFGARWGSLHVFQLHFILLDSINHSFLLR